MIVGLIAIGPTLIAGQAKQGAISGFVIDASNGAPIANAIVALDGPAGAMRQRTLTDAKGRFVFHPLEPSDDYMLSAERAGYAVGRFGWKPGASEAVRDRARIAIANGEWRRDVPIRMWRLGSIRGRVLDEVGQPVVGVTVAPLANVWMAGREHVVAGNFATTDDRGAYRLDGLSSGEYFVMALSTQSSVPASTPGSERTRALGELERQGLRPEGPSVTAPGALVGQHRLLHTNAAVPPVSSSSGPDLSYPPVFHPSALTKEGAARVSLGLGEDRSDIDMLLTPVQTFTVGGRVLGPAGPGVVLRLMPVGFDELGFGFEIATALTGRDGSFAFLRVPRGSYLLLAQQSVMEFSSGDRPARMPAAPGFEVEQSTAGSYAGTPGLSFSNHVGRPYPYWARTDVQVSDDISDLRIELRSTLTVSGRLEAMANGAPATIGRPIIFAEPATGNASLGNPSARANEDGTFVLHGLLPGRYLLRTFTGPLIASVTYQGKPVTDTGLDTTSGSNLEDVVVSMTGDAGALAGKVSGASSAAHAAVIVFPVEPSLWRDFGWNPSRIKVAQTDRNGAYSIGRLLSGDYFVIAVDVAEANSWVQPGFLSAASKLAIRQPVAWGQKATLDLAEIKVVRK